MLGRSEAREQTVRDKLSGAAEISDSAYVRLNRLSPHPTAIRTFRQSHPDFNVKLAHFVIAHHVDALRIGDRHRVGRRCGGIGGPARRSLAKSTGLSLRSRRDPGLPAHRGERLDLADEPFLTIPRYGATGLHVSSELLRTGGRHSARCPRDQRTRSADFQRSFRSWRRARQRRSPILPIPACVTELAPESPVVNFVALSRSRTIIRSLQRSSAICERSRPTTNRNARSLPWRRHAILV